MKKRQALKVQVTENALVKTTYLQMLYATGVWTFRKLRDRDCIDMIWFKYTARVKDKIL